MCQTYIGENKTLVTSYLIQIQKRMTKNDEEDINALLIMGTQRRSSNTRNKLL